MSFSTSDSAIRMTPQLADAISKASPDEIKSLMAQAALQQGLVVPDSVNPQILHETELAAHAPQKFGKYITINSQKYLVEGDSPEALANAETELYQQLFEKGDNGQARDAQGRFVAEPTPAEKAAQELAVINRTELELKFKRGDITAEAYLEQSGAVTSYLQNHGMNPEALTAVSDLVYQNTWANATEAFLNSPEGESWPGGEQNMRMLAALMEENGLTEPSVENIAAAYNYARENDMLVENPETAAHNAIADATDMESIRAALGRPSSSGLFDRR